MLRSCYGSKWKLFRGGNRLRDGYYYFSPEGTPFYPGLHNLWSRHWVSDDDFENATLGEWDGKETYHNGEAPTRLPLPIQIGSDECIRDGEDPDLPSQNDNCERRGRLLPLECYSELAELIRLTNVWDCRFAYQCARILETQTESLDDAAAMCLTLFPTATISTYPIFAELIPNCMVVRVGLTCLAFVTGTSNAQQAALQTFYAGQGPVSQGRFSCSVAYNSSANKIAEYIGAAGAGDSNRFVLIGHSYGGATAYILAAKMLVAVPERKVELLTFGMPKSGDRRLVDLVSPIRQRHWINEGDPVPLVPPRGTTFFDLFAFVSAPLMFAWETFATPPTAALLTDAGTIEYTTRESVDWDILVTVYQAIDAVLDVVPFQAHFLHTFATRLRAACPYIDADCDEFPYPPPPPPVLSFRLTHLRFHSENRPYDNSVNLAVGYVENTQTWFGQNTTNQAVSFHPSDLNFDAGTTLLVILTQVLNGHGVGPFLWTFNYLDVVAGLISTDLPTTTPEAEPYTSIHSMNSVEIDQDV